MRCSPGSIACPLLWSIRALLVLSLVPAIALAQDGQPLGDASDVLAVEFGEAGFGTDGEPGDASLAEGCPSCLQTMSVACGNGCALSPCPSCAAAATAHQSLFYNNRFDYLLDNPCCAVWPGDGLKRRCLGDCIVWDVGGQYRARAHHERNHRRLGLTGIDDDFLLHRTRLYANVEAGTRLRLYIEYLDAESNYENSPPLLIDVNRSDLLNAFADLQLGDGLDHETLARVGRQEMEYGNQRLISTLDWSNTRRTFDGAKIQHRGATWNVDGFYTQPVFPQPRSFDQPDDEQDFWGVYATRTGAATDAFDVYYLVYDNRDEGFDYHTVGTRCQSSYGSWLWEFEGAVQLGDNADGSSHQAGFAVGGWGYRLDDHPWKPTLWAFYDWASGGDRRGASHGFHHLFPLGHRYLGFMDLYGRQNLEAPNVRYTFTPLEKLTVLVWYHYFFLENKQDVPYNLGMIPFNPGAAPVSAELGHEVDLALTYKFNPRMALLVGYSHFFAGDYYRLTPGVPFRGDADFFYTELTWNF